MSTPQALLKGSPSTPNAWPALALRDFTARGKKYSIVDGPFGSNLKTIHYRLSGIPIVTSGFVTSGSFHANAYLYVDERKFNQEIRSAVYPGDIVMAKIGARCGASAILPHDHPTGILSGNALKISIDETRHSTEYVALVLRWLYERGSLEILRSTGAQPAISMPLLKRLELPCPPLPVQREIATTVADADSLIVALERWIAKKQAIKRGMMQELLTGKTRLTGFAEQWRVKPLGDLTTIVSGGTPRTAVPSYWNGGIPWCTPTDITGEAGRYLSRTERTISREGLDQSGAQLLPVGSLLLCTRATIGEVKIAVVPTATNQGFKSLVPLPGISSEFLYYTVLTLKDELASKGTGSTFLEVSKRDVAALELKVPALDEQSAIAEVLADADDEIDLLKRRLGKAIAMKTGMMQELLTGRIRLRVDEAAV